MVIVNKKNSVRDSSKKFNYIGMKGLIELNSMSPSGNYYRFKEPIWLNMTNIGCKIAFYNNASKLIYYREGTFAHQIKPHIIIQFVKWSECGDYCLFFEFKDNSIYCYIYILISKMNAYIE